MIKKTILSFFTLAMLLCVNIKAQDDSKCGILIDGVLVDSITCWSFSEMSVICPIKAEWKKFDAITVSMLFYYGDMPEAKPFSDYSIEFKKKDFMDGILSNVDYIIRPVFKDKSIESTFKGSNGTGAKKEIFMCTSTDYYNKEKDQALKNASRAIFRIVVKGYYIVGTQEKWDGQAYIKTPKYGNEEIVLKSKEINAKRKYAAPKDLDKFYKKNPDTPLLNTNGNNFSSITGDNYYDMTQPCSSPGIKLDIKYEAVNYRDDILVVKKK